MRSLTNQVRQGSLLFLCFWVVGFWVVGCSAYQSDTKRTPGEITDDVYIQAAVKTALVRSDQVDGLDINVDVHKGVVTVYGPVLSQAAKTHVTELAQRVRGVKDVVNRLTVVDG